MSKRRDIEEHVRTLGEIEGIMGAMKNLSLMESHKLNRVLATQHQVVNEIEAAGRDFLSFYPSHAPEFSHHDLYLVIGAERGFCKDFNDRLLSALDDHLKGTDDRDPVLVVVGRKLLQRAEQVHPIAAFVEGSTVAEEVPSVLIRVIDQLREIAARHELGGKVSVAAVYHDPATETVVVRRLRPFQSLSLEAKAASFPPLLTLPPDKFFAELVDLYLYSVLHAIFYSALMAESRARLAHLESALQRLERDQADLLRKRNVLRQEEITEEIEVLMLSDFIAPRRRHSRDGGKGDAMSKDPVCQMDVDEQSAAGTSTYEGITYYFCSPGCREAFEKDPGRYLPVQTDLLGRTIRSNK